MSDTKMNSEQFEQTEQPDTKINFETLLKAYNQLQKDNEQLKLAL